MADRIRGAAKGDAISGIVRQVVEKHPATAARTLARRVVAETGGAITLEQARARVRICLGVKGKAARKSSTTKRRRPAPRSPGSDSSGSRRGLLSGGVQVGRGSGTECAPGVLDQEKGQGSGAEWNEREFSEWFSQSDQPASEVGIAPLQ